jgi:p-hydroxybenzoate 3-monooxygenase
VRTQVVVIGAGPAGLVLANALQQAGIDCVVAERETRRHVVNRARAGMLEHRTVELLRGLGLADGLLAKGSRRSSCEFRWDDRRVVLRYGELTGGREHHVYPQQHLVADLLDAFTAHGGTVLFSHPAVALSAGTVTLWPPRAVAPIDIGCDFVAGCDGFHGISRRTLHEHVGLHERSYPFGWVTALIQPPGGTDEVVYALHPNGFAGRMPRTATTSRCYLQCATADQVRDWPDERVRDELGRRLGEALPVRAEIAEKSVMRLRSSMVGGMTHANVALLGDAAHLVTPAGAKGMNLAVQDAVALADGLRVHYREGLRDPLPRYGRERLDKAWLAQEFSHWMLDLISGPEPGDPFARNLRLARVRRLLESRSFATAFARTYVGM